MNKLRLLSFLMTALLAMSGYAKSLVVEPASTELGKSIDVPPVWLNKTIYPDGRGLPAGNGTHQLGMVLYQKHCVACHGDGGKGGSGGQLVAPILPKDVWAKSPRPSKHVGQYWPYATTLFDYIRRAMPYQAPGSLSDNDVYSLVAYILAEQKIISNDFLVNAQTLPTIKMPNRESFIRK